jgi:hypothetical protein
MESQPLNEANKERLTVEIPAITSQQVLYLLESTGMTKTQLVILALDRLYAATVAEQTAA